MNTVQTLCSALRSTVCNHHVLSKAEGFALLALEVRAKRSNPSGTALRLSGESCQSSAGREWDSATLGSTRRQMTTNSGRGYSESQGKTALEGWYGAFCKRRTGLKVPEQVGSITLPLQVSPQEKRQVKNHLLYLLSLSKGDLQSHSKET